MAFNYVVAGSVGKFLREEFSAISRHVIENAGDEIQRRIILNTSAVRTSTALGRPPGGAKNSSSQFQAMHSVSFGRSGTIKYQSIGGLLGNDSPPMLTKTLTYPSATTVPQRTAEWMLIDLKWIMGNLTIDQRQWMALKQGNPVEDFLAKWLKDPYEIVLQQLTTDFFGSGYGVVGQVKATTAAITAGSEGVVTINGSVRKFWRGQRVVLYQNTSGLPNATQRGTGVVCVVTKVHSFTTDPTITLLNTHGATAITPTATDWILLEGAWDGSATSGVLGMDIFTNNSVAIHGLSKTDYPEVQSYSDVPGTDRTPTPLVLQKAVDAVADRGFRQPDLIATTRGVRSLYYQQEAMFKTYNTDYANPVARGADGGNTGNMQYTTEQGVVPIAISPFVGKGKAYLIRLDSLVRYAPGGMDAVQFLGDNELLGGNMFMGSIASGGDRTTVFEAPFSYWYENGCLEPQCNGVIGNLSELADVA